MNEVLYDGSDPRTKEREQEKQLRNFWGMLCFVVIFAIALALTI